MRRAFELLLLLFLVFFLLFVTVVEGGERWEEEERRLQNSQRGLIDVIDLIPFDVQIALVADDEDELPAIEVYQVMDIVTEWMNDSFRKQLENFGYIGNYAKFDAVYLIEREEDERRQLRVQSQVPSKQQSTNAYFPFRLPRFLQNTAPDEEQGASSFRSGHLYTARLGGFALFARDNELRTQSIPVDDVLDIQRLTMLDENLLLLRALQDSDAAGLGRNVVDVQPTLQPTTGGNNNNQFDNRNDSDNDDELELVIVIAVAVAAVAFLFLMVAIYWAWSYDRRNREAYLVDGAKNGKRFSTDRTNPVDRTGSDTTIEDDGKASPAKKKSMANNNNNSPANVVNTAESANPVSSYVRPYPTEIYSSSAGLMGPHDNFSASDPIGSTISDDISTSFSQYYRSGIASMVGSANNNNSTSKPHYQTAYYNRHAMNDVGSISSMESYGYSLEGYAPTITTPTPQPHPGTNNEIYSPHGNNNNSNNNYDYVDRNGSGIGSEIDAPMDEDGGNGAILMDLPLHSSGVRAKSTSVIPRIRRFKPQITPHQSRERILLSHTATSAWARAASQQHNDDDDDDDSYLQAAHQVQNNTNLTKSTTIAIEHHHSKEEGDDEKNSSNNNSGEQETNVKQLIAAYQKNFLATDLQRQDPAFVPPDYELSLQPQSPPPADTDTDTDVRTLETGTDVRTLEEQCNGTIGNNKGPVVNNTNNITSTINPNELTDGADNSTLDSHTMESDERMMMGAKLGQEMTPTGPTVASKTAAIAPASTKFVDIDMSPIRFESQFHQNKNNNDDDDSDIVSDSERGTGSLISDSHWQLQPPPATNKPAFLHTSLYGQEQQQDKDA